MSKGIGNSSVTIMNGVTSLNANGGAAEKGNLTLQNGSGISINDTSGVFQVNNTGVVGVKTDSGATETGTITLASTGSLTITDSPPGTFTFSGPGSAEFQCFGTTTQTAASTTPTALNFASVNFLVGVTATSSSLLTLNSGAAGYWRLGYSCTAVSSAGAATAITVQTWLRQNGSALPASSRIHTLYAPADRHTLNGEILVQLADGDTLEVFWQNSSGASVAIQNITFNTFNTIGVTFRGNRIST